MKKKAIFGALAAMAIVFIYSVAVYAEEIKPIELLPPQMEGGKPLMKALKDRKSMRAFASKSCRHKYYRTYSGQRAE